MRTALVIICGILLLAAPSLATPYLISYGADTPGSFPEDEGWGRSTSGSPGATRAVEEGLFTLSSDDITVTDVYFWNRPEDLDPEAGELFFAEWRVLIVAISNEAFWDPGISIASNTSTDLGIRHSLDRVVDINSFASFPVSPGEFHTYRLESEDMWDYRLWVDGELGLTGEFRDSLSRDFVAFGDAVGGVASTSTWDYVRFGVVLIPEPGFATLAVLLGGVPMIRRCRGTSDAKRGKSERKTCDENEAHTHSLYCLVGSQHPVGGF